MIITIRNEQPADYREVETLTREAFWNVYRPGCIEHFVLHKFRQHPLFIAELSFVMEADGKIIGHVMFSKAAIIAADGSEIPACTFGPISIHPAHQRKGYGLRLLNYSLQKAKEMGIGLLCMESNIEFYKHAGFVVASTLAIHYHGEAEDAEAPYFLAQELSDGYLGGRTGTYHTPRPYFVAEGNPEEFAIFDASFERKEKHLAEGQLPQFCQCCGMPLRADADCGTEADGSTCFDYCKFCYTDGHFVQQCSMEEMIDHCSQFVGEFNKHTGASLTREAYKMVLEGYFPTLKRWRK